MMNNALVHWVLDVHKKSLERCKVIDKRIEEMEEEFKILVEKYDKSDKNNLKELKLLNERIVINRSLREKLYRKRYNNT